VITILIAAALILADQVTKVLAAELLQPVADIPLIDGVLHLHYAQNTGVAFSLLSGGDWIIVALTSAVAAAIAAYVLTHKNEVPKTAKILLGVILGGAVGNLIDRIFLGYVVDFIYVKIINFAIFNIADCGITVGAVLLMVWILWSDRKSRKAEAAKAAQEAEAAPQESEDDV